jgi:hypothetical protein
MRWKPKPEHKAGDMRIKSGFLFFPKCLQGEWRWLEDASWGQELVVTHGYVGGLDGTPEETTYIYWQSIRWVQ